MKIVIPGGSGNLGRLLTRHLARSGHEVVVLSRSPGDVAGAARVVPWDGRSVGAWAQELEGAGAVINLAGRSVDCRYGRANRRAIRDSRVESTRAVGNAIAACAHPPTAWLQMSTATIYAHRFDAPHDERTGIVGGSEPGAPDTWRFSIDVATAWEREAGRHRAPGTRQVLMRSAIVMEPSDSGPLGVLRRLTRAGLGGRAATGRQMVSWIHGDDFARAVEHLLTDEGLSGPVNVCSPTPVTNASMMRGLRAAVGCPLGVPASRWMLEIGAFVMRTETELILKSRYVVPSRLLGAGFVFRHPDWQDAARDLCGRMGRAKSAAAI